VLCKEASENIALDNRKVIFHSSRMRTPDDNQQNTADRGKDHNSNDRRSQKSWKQDSESKRPGKKPGSVDKIIP